MTQPGSASTDYLTYGDVLRMHQEMMEGDASPSILLDEGKLESAILRAENTAHYADADIFQQAATLTAGIALAHAFEDGNKRLAYAVCLTFLHINGIRMAASPREMADQVLGLVNRDGKKLDPALNRFAAWLSDHQARLTS